jgi:acyl-coenzyme A synthetase/AMP-(fatty) acid ligase
VRFDRLPRNDLGKVLRRVIRQDIEQRLQRPIRAELS